MRRALLILALLIVPNSLAAQETGDATAGSSEPATASDDTGLRLSTNLGITKFLDGGPTGFGLDIFPGYEIGWDITVEAQLGVHRGREDFGAVGTFLVGTQKVTSTVIPFEVGARWSRPVGPVSPFAALHMGPAALRACVAGTCDGEVKFDLNFGGGANYDINEMIGIGAAMWFHNVFIAEGDGDDLQLFHFGVNATFSM